jgi:hypothetical protein
MNNTCCSKLTIMLLARPAIGIVFVRHDCKRNPVRVANPLNAEKNSKAATWVEKAP